MFPVLGQVSGPILVLNGEGEKSSGPVNNVVFLEETAPSYAPEVCRLHVRIVVRFLGCDP